MDGRRRSSTVMASVGALLVLAWLAWLVWGADPLSMWIVMCGGGLVFLGTAAALRRRRPRG
jgi:hypothetical protein